MVKFECVYIMVEIERMMLRDPKTRLITVLVVLHYSAITNGSSVTSQLHDLMYSLQLIVDFNSHDYDVVSLASLYFSSYIYIQPQPQPQPQLPQA